MMPARMAMSLPSTPSGAAIPGRPDAACMLRLLTLSDAGLASIWLSSLRVYTCLVSDGRWLHGMLTEGFTSSFGVSGAL